MNIPSKYDFNYKNDSDPMNIVSGIAINGVPFMPALSLQKQDIFNYFKPRLGSKKTESSEISEMDQCLGRVNSSGKYIYSTMSPCLYESQYGETFKVCSLQKNCDFKNQMMKQQKKKLSVIGIAKDGNLIFGPYSQNEKLWSKDRIDVCGGTFLKKNEFDNTFDVEKLKTQSIYGYVARTTFPYLNGCYGPANFPQFLPQCTKNASGIGGKAPILIRHIH